MESTKIARQILLIANPHYNEKMLSEATEIIERALDKAWQECALEAQNDAAREIQKNYIEGK